MDAAQRGVTASRREGGGGKTVTSARTLWGFPGCSVTCTSESARPASAALRCVHTPQIKAAEGEGGTCGRDDEPPISLSIVGGIQKGRLFYFQTCGRKSLSAPGLQSVYVVNIPGAAPAAVLQRSHDGPGLLGLDLVAAHSKPPGQRGQRGQRSTS